MRDYSRRKPKKRRWPIFILAILLLCGALYLPLRRVVETRMYPIAYSETVERWADECDISPYLVYAIIHTESGFNARADSHAGARGLMQMTEETFEWLKPTVAPGENLTFDDLYNPEVSIRFGTKFYAMCLARYSGDIPTAAAAYHSGWGTVDALLADGAYSGEGQNWLTAFPYAQMNHYVNKINKSYLKYMELYENE